MGGKPQGGVIVQYAGLDGVDRGGGVITSPIVEREHGPEHFISGTTSIPPGTEIPLHKHNCDEQVTVLEGRAEVRYGDRTGVVEQFDTTFVPAGIWHQFRNIGEHPLVILWVYGALEVTRTFAHSGETVAHLSSADVAK